MFILNLSINDNSVIYSTYTAVCAVSMTQTTHCSGINNFCSFNKKAFLTWMLLLNTVKVNLA